MIGRMLGRRAASTAAALTRTQKKSRAARAGVVATLAGVGGIWVASDPREAADGNRLATALALVPTRTMSRVWGCVHNQTLPDALRAPVYKAWIHAFGCNEAEITRPLGEFACLAEFFTRGIAEEARPVARDALVVSPSDGKLVYFGPVEGNLAEQVKGVSYDTARFLGRAELPAPSSPDRALYHCIVYLAPGDYHRFHSPADWSARVLRHAAGELLSVAPALLRVIPGLFSINERVVLEGSWDHGYFAMAAVGAYNVGSISLTAEGPSSALRTNRAGDRIGAITDAEIAVSAAKGDEVGAFNLGSTIVLVFEGPRGLECTYAPGDLVRMGEALVK